MSMKKQLAELESKTKLLQFKIAEAEKVRKKDDREATTRHRDSIRTLSGAIDVLKSSIEEAKFSQGEDAEAVQEWSVGPSAELDKADTCCNELTKQLKQMDEQEISIEEVRRQKSKLDFERHLLEEKIKIENQNKEQAGKVKPTVKLPKITIAKFNGTVLDWLRFEGQFNAMIHDQDISVLTKFSQLKEHVDHKVRGALDCLPFKEESYDKARKYLKDKYGHPNEIAGAYIINLLELSPILDRDVAQIHRFYEKLSFSVESLQTLGKLETVQGNAYYVIAKKLEVLKSELVTHMDGDWRDWDFLQLVEALKRWTEVNTVVKSDKRGPKRSSTPSGGRSFHARDNEACVYCGNPNHKCTDCDKVVTFEERKKTLASKRLCFNCANGQHLASACKSKMLCQKCNRRHHTSICPQLKLPDEPGMTTDVGANAVIHPYVVVKICGYKFRALLDSGASHSYASSTLLRLVKARAANKSVRRIATLLSTETTKLVEYDLTLRDVHGNFELATRLTGINKQELLMLDNPKLDQLIQQYQHLRNVQLDDVSTKDHLPVHLILGANEYAQIKTSEPPRVGRQGEPVAEHTCFGWAVMAPGVGADLSAGLLAVNSTTDYEQLCALDVLGLADTPTGDQQVVYHEFKEQLSRDPNEGWYETGLTWKGNHPPLLNNKENSLRRLNTQLGKLRRAGMLSEYDTIIQEQLDEGIVELAPDHPVGQEFYMPHRAVVREGAESTKLRIVYDCSARACASTPSLNECLDPGPALQNKLWNVLVRGRFHAVALAGDLRKAFLQVRIRKEERDALRFHWLRDLHSTEVIALRFTRALFGLAPSPFLLGGVIEQHLESWSDRLPERVLEILRSLYVDDLISGAPTVPEAQQLKSEAIMVFADASFQLHKWHSNVPELESPKSTPSGEEEISYAKQQLGSDMGECKLLGLGWNKGTDTLSVNFPEGKTVTTKRGILGKLARVYDPLGLVSPVTVQGKFLYREACELKQGWDTPLPKELTTRWQRWESAVPLKVSLPRSLAPHCEQIDAIALHAFGDASGRGVSTAVYAVVHQASGVTQGLVAAKSRLAKQGQTIPRLELIASHMATNAVSNVRTALEGFPIVSVHCWTDSMVVLHWIRGGGEYRQFVTNRIRKIQGHQIDGWQHVPTKENPADLGSRGGSVTGAELWWRGPDWLATRDKWPPNPVTSPSPESQAEAKLVKEVMAVAVNVPEMDEFDLLLERCDLRRTLRVMARIARFLSICRASKRLSGPLTTEEEQLQLAWWVRREQRRAQALGQYQNDQQRLNLQPNDDGILVCQGRIQGHYPVYLSVKSTLAEKLVVRHHRFTLHGGVILTMASVRERFWIPKLRQLVKKVVNACQGCMRFRATPCPVPPPGLLPKSRTEGSTAFEVVGTDFAGPIRYRVKPKKEGKAYLTLFACSLTRALHLELSRSLEAVEFLRSLKRLVARRGRPAIIYSDNGSTFISAAKWLRIVRRDERLQGYLAEHEIRWNFNLSRAPWWGGQFERLIGVFKQAFFKTIGGATLSWDELSDVVLEVETQLNRRPLGYVEDDVQLPLLTPATFLFQRSNMLPEAEPWREEQVDLRRRAKYLLNCKNSLWKRWSSEYLTALRERHNCKTDGEPRVLKVGDVVIIRSEEKNRGKWPLGIVMQLYPGKDGVVRAVKLRAGRSYLERPVQHLYPLELTCDRQPPPQPGGLNPEAQAFRPKRAAAVKAADRIKDIAHQEQH